VLAGVAALVEGKAEQVGVGLPVQQVDDPLLAPRTSRKQRRSVHPLHLKEPKAMTVPIQRSSRSGVGKLGGGAVGLPEVGAGWSRQRPPRPVRVLAQEPSATSAPVSSAQPRCFAF
jgi:hypothetical protein